MQREHWYYEVLGNRELTQVAADVHATNTGACERLDYVHDLDLKALQHALDTWRDDPKHKKYDDAVKRLIEIAVTEKHWLRAALEGASS